MLDAVVGSVIMVVATTSLLFAVEVAEKAFDNSGRYRLNEEEKSMLVSLGFSEQDLEAFWQNNLVDAPREVGSSE